MATKGIHEAPPVSEGLFTRIAARTGKGIVDSLKLSVASVLNDIETALRGIVKKETSKLLPEGELDKDAANRLRKLIGEMKSPWQLIDIVALFATYLTLAVKRYKAPLGIFGELVDRHAAGIAQIELPGPGDLLRLLQLQYSEPVGEKIDLENAWVYDVDALGKQADLEALLERHGYGPKARSRLLGAQRAIPDLGLLDEARRRGDITSVIWDKLYTANFASGAMRHLRRKLLYQLPDEGILLEAVRRGKLTWRDASSKMKKAGAGQDRLAVLEDTYSRLLGESQLLEMRRRGVLTEKELGTGLGKLGYDKDDADNVAKLFRQLLGAGEAVTMFQRQIISEKSLDTILLKLGYKSSDVDNYIKLASREPSFDVLLRSMWRGKSTQDQYAKQLKDTGIPDKYLNDYIAASKPMLGPAEILRLWRREKLPQFLTPEEELGRLGYDKVQVQQLKDATELRPGIGDMVRFAVREAYRPDIVKLYKLDEDYPAQFEKEAKQIGLPPEYTKYYWRAHWELPSVQMGYEMFHRNIINKKELRTLLRIADVMPFWRDKLIEIAHILPTRVDARRMYKYGIYDKDDLVDLYERRGYEAQAAKDMAKLAIAMATSKETSSERDATKADVLRWYREAQLSEAETRSTLKDMGYVEEYIALYIAREDVKIADERRSAGKRLVETRFKRGVADITETTVALTDLGYTPEEVSYWADLWGVQRMKGIHLLSKTELRKLYELKKLTRPNVIDELGRIGYDAGRAELIVETWI